MWSTVTTVTNVINGVPIEKVDELVRNRTLPLQELTIQQRENIAQLKEKLDLNERQVRAALTILGENDVPPERLAAKLVEIAERFKALQATASAEPGDDPRIAALKADAQKAIDAGELAKADALLADVETEQRRALDRLAFNAADTSARRGEIALTRLRYTEAAMHFANAAAVLPQGRAAEDTRTSYLQKEAYALYQQGNEFGDNGALLLAIERCKRLVLLMPRERVPRDWALSENRLGIVLGTLGMQKSDTARLKEAIVAFREALTEMTRERGPLDWALTQNNLGVALDYLGKRESNTAKVEEAVAAYREALKERTRERVPLEWAATQNNLGNALQDLGRRESNTAKVEEAVAAYREALNEQTRERVPLEWAATQNNLGNALQDLGTRENDRARLEEAVAAYREALKEITRERAPLQWAQTQRNLGLVRFNRGDFAAAALDLQEAEDGTNAYTILWLYLARARTGTQDAKSNLERRSAGLKPAQWPSPVIKLFLEQGTPEAMVAAADKPEERCEAQFYLGEWHLLKGARANSIEALRDAVKSCPKDFIEYAGALAELKRLAQ
jgi:tetratricopeptide (TPR) repeat protein